MKTGIVKKLESFSGRYSLHTVFSDWVEMMALSIQNSCCFTHNQIWKNREERYLQICKKYTNGELIELCNMFGMLALHLEDNTEDALGDIYMRSGCSSKQLGQFFTPYHLSKLTAQLLIQPKVQKMTELKNKKNELEQFDVLEPACGGGSMIIGIADCMNEVGLNYQRILNVVAQDLDWMAVHMTYVQLSLLGIKAVVVQGDTLTEPYTDSYPEERTFRTPAKMGVLI